MENVRKVPSLDKIAVFQVLALLGLSALIYCRVLDFGFFPVWDDSLYLLDRPEVVDWFGASWAQRILTPELGYPVPIPTFFYYLFRQLSPEWVVPGVHLLSLAFHMVSVVLVYKLAGRWLGSNNQAFCATALWASHPLLVESVAWATNLKVVTLSAFLLGSLLLWEKHLERPSWGRAIGAVGLFILALGCRPEAIVIGPLWLGLLVLRGPSLREVIANRFVDWRRTSRWVPLSAVGLLSLVYLPVSMAGQQKLLDASSTIGQKDIFAADPVQFELICKALGLQFRHIIAPLNLQPTYLPIYPMGPTDFWIGVVFGVCLLLASIIAFRSNSNSQYGLLLWWALYLPASNIAFLPRFTADTYMYLPLAGLALALVAALVEGRKHVPTQLHKYAVIVAMLVVTAAGALTFAQSLRWLNPLSLWAPLVQAQPYNPQGYWYLGATYVGLEEWQKAAEVYESGYPYLRRRQRIPFKMVIAFEKVDRPQDAAMVAAEIVTYPGLKSDAAPAALLRLAAHPNVRLAELPEVVSAIRYVLVQGVPEEVETSERVELARRLRVIGAVKESALLEGD